MEQPIVVFDSGVGGISVLRELVRQLPHERFVYFGDSANAPYGTRTTQEIRRLTLEAIAALQGEHFKAAVIACNTATSAAIEQLRAAYADIPIIGIEPALKPAVDRYPGKKIVVLATQTTLREEKFAALAQHYSRDNQIIRRPAPELVEFVERGELDGARVEASLAQLLSDCTDASAVVLGCTHFPFLRDAIARVLPNTELFDGAVGTARETKRRLQALGKLRQDGDGSVQLRNSLTTPQIFKLSAKLLEAPQYGGTYEEKTE